MTQVHAAWIRADGSGGAVGSEIGLFPWWSFTKTVLAACALRLVEDGRIDLDALRPGKPYSLRQLLNHQAGVPNYGALPKYHAAVARNDVPWSRKRLMQAVGDDRLDFPPGSGWSYSNVGYMFVREVIEAATARPIGAALHDLVLAPLGVPSARVAAGPNDFRRVFWPELHGYDPGWVYHGCLIGTPTHAAIVLHGLLAGQLLKPETLGAMQAYYDLGGAIPGRPWIRCGYGLGLMCGEMAEAGRAIGHSGGGPFGVNAVYHFPDTAMPITVAAFTGGIDEGVAEHAAAAIACFNQQ